MPWLFEREAAAAPAVKAWAPVVNPSEEQDDSETAKSATVG